MRTALTLGLVGVLSLLGCGSGEDDDEPEPNEVPVDLWEQREVLGQLPFRHDGLAQLRVDADRVYVGVNEISQDDLLLGAHLYALPKAGGALEPMGDEFTHIARLHEEGSTVFVASPDESGDAVNAVSKLDAENTVLGSADQIMEMTATESDVFVACLGGAYSEGPSIQRFERASGTKSEFWLMGDVRALAVRGDELFVATNGVGVWRRALAGETDAVRVSEDALPVGAQVAFSAGGERLFWVGDGTLAEVSLEDGSVSELPYDSEAVRLGRLSSSGSSLVWSELDGNGVGLGVMHWSIESDAPVFREIGGVGVEVVTDGSHVYGVTGYEVWRLPLTAFAE